MNDAHRARAPLAALRARFVPAHRRPVRDRLPPRPLSFTRVGAASLSFGGAFPRLFFRSSSPRNIQRSSSDGVSFAAHSTPPILGRLGRLRRLHGASQLRRSV